MIPVCTPTLTGKEWEYVKSCFDKNFIGSTGEYIQKFEDAFAKFCECKYGVTTTSGTTALHLAVASAGLKKGDEIIMPSFTMMASANAAIYEGVKPIVVDADAETWTINPSLIEEKITERTKAIMPVHIYGHPCDMDPLLKIAKKHNLIVIEDAAEAHGALYNNKKVGSFGEINCFSFYGNKIITTGEGGMIVTNNKELAERAQLLKNLAFTKPRFYHHELGFNYRMTNIQAAIGLAQFESIEKFIKARRDHAKLYNELLKDVKGIQTPPESKKVRNVYWMYGILIEDSLVLTKDQVMAKLMEKGVETRCFFLPMNQQPLFLNNQQLANISGSYPVADNLWKRGLYLPSSSSLTEEDIHSVVKAIKELK